MTRKTGRHFFANPGPTNIPDSVLRAMDRSSLDFLDPEFIEVFDAAVAGLGEVRVVEAVATAGYYTTLAMTMNTARTPPPDGAPRLPARDSGA